MLPTEISENSHFKDRLFNRISTKDKVGIIQRVKTSLNQTKFKEFKYCINATS